MDTRDNKRDDVLRRDPATHAPGDLVEESHPHDAYWRENFTNRPYVQPGAHFDDYAPAYRYGRECVVRYGGHSFDEAEADIRKEWEEGRGASKLDWEDARHAIRDAWNWVKRDIDHD